jgi:DNA invertase Pin-like site-specific DNA recombinase
MSADKHSIGSLIPAAAYYRRSTRKQEDSIARQRSQVQPYAAAHGYAIVDEYLDDAISGSEQSKRKGFLKLLADAQQGKFTTILVDEDDRFCRFDSIDYGYFVKPLRDKGITLVTVAKGLSDWNSFGGRITSAVATESKHQEQQSIARRTLSGMLNHAVQGKPLGGRRTYGYEIKYRKGTDAKGRRRLFPVCYKPDPKTAPVVQLIFRLAAEGKTLAQISKELHTRGVPSPGGKEVWGRNVLLSILTRRKYVGDFVWGQRPSGKRMRYDPAGKEALRERRHGEGQSCRNATADCTLKKDAHKALVRRDTFQKVQALLKGNKARSTPHVGGGGFILSRLLVCAHCGAFLRGYTRPNGDRMFICGSYLDYGKNHCSANHVHEQMLVDLLVKQLQQEWLAPARLARLREEAARLEREARGDESLARLKGELAAREKDVATATARLFAVDADNMAEANAYLRECKVRRDQAREAFQKAQEARPVQDLEEVIAAAEQSLWSLREALQAEDRELLRETFRQTFSKIVLHFEHRQTAHHTRSKLVQAEAFVRPQEQGLDLFTSGSRSSS